MGELKVIAHYMRGYRAALAMAAVCCALETLLELLIPFLMAQMVDQGIGGGDMRLVYAMGVRMLVAAAAAGLCGLGEARFGAKAAMGLGANLRHAEYAQVQGYAFSNLDEFKASSLVTRMTTDITVIQNSLAQGMRPMLRGPIMMVLGLVVASMLSARLAVVFFVVLPFLAVVLFLILRRVAPLYGVLQDVMDSLNDTIQEDLVAIRAIKAFVREDWAAARFDRVNRSYADTATRTFGTAVLNTPVFQLSMYVTSVALLWFGGQMIMAGELGVGALTGFMSYVLLIMNSLMMISSVFLLLARAITSVRRVSQVLEEQPAITNPKSPVGQVETGEVELRDVSFKYSADAEKDVLEHVSLHLEPGSTVGLMGSTGAGKTTLVQLLPRLYDASEGQVLVGGHDVRAYDLAALRAGVGIVLQTNVLFTGTVRENLLWGNPQATDEELLGACKLACADEFLDRIGGLDGDLGQGGANVSGGQKQRLCIARALLAHPRVLVLDSATSACDMATDARIHSNLAGLSGMTKIVIDQRVSSVMGADKIVILEDGRLHAQGTHEELLANDPVYQDLYYSQTAAARPDAPAEREADDGR